MLRCLVGRTWFVLFLAALTNNANGQTPRLVGEFSDLSRTEIRGLTTFTVENVRGQLVRDSEAILAAHPFAQLNDLSEVVNQRLLAGLQRAGFADAKVRTVVDDENSRLIADVTEGPRFLNGSLRIENTKKVDVFQLRRRLTERFPPRQAVTPFFNENTPGQVTHWADQDGRQVEWSDPVWVPEEFAKLDEVSLATIQRQVSNAFEDLGFRDARFDLSLDPNRETGRVDMVVRLNDEGDAAELGEIVIRGNERNSADAIINYLGLSAGTVLTRRRETQVRYDLWRSGRFISTQVLLVEPFANNRHTLIVTTRESPYSPPIEQPLDKNEETLLKLGRWLSNPNAWTSDMVFHSRSETDEYTAILSPREGLLVSAQSLDDEARQPVVLVGSRQEVGVYPSGSLTHLRTAAPISVFAIQLQLQLNEEPDAELRPYRFNFGFNFSNRKAGDFHSPIRIEAHMPPAMCLAIANAPNAKISWTGNVLTVATDREVYEIDGQDGHLVGYQIPSTTIDAGFSFVDKAFARALDTAHQSVNDRKNAYEKERPLHSIFSFIGRDEIFENWSPLLQSIFKDKVTQQDVELMRVAAQLYVALGVLDPIDKNLIKPSSSQDSEEEEFKIPAVPSGATVSWVNQTAFALIPVADGLFPRDSWPWTVWREAGFLIAGHSNYSSQQVRHFFTSEEVGPTGLLVVARLLNCVNPQAAQAIALRGTQLTSSESFSRDYLPLLDPTRLSGKCIRHACELLISLEKSELLELQGKLPDPWGNAFSVFSHELRRDANRPMDESILSALDEAWESGLNLVVMQMLSDISAQSAAKLAEKPSDKIQR